MEVRLVALKGDGKKGGEKKTKESDLKKKHRREALDNPLVQDVLDVFQAEVIDIKVL